MKIDNAERLPCGCIIGEHGDAFVIQPCDITCDNLAYVIAESSKQGKTITPRMGRVET